MMEIKLDVVSGFLGAGKTTLIKKLLEEKLKTERVAIIENEFGAVGIDGSILKNTGIEVKEIRSGCICCTLLGDFEKSLLEVAEKYRPDRIIIEPSGVGKLSDVLKACTGPKVRETMKINMLAAVVDVQKYEMYINNFGEFYKDQIKNAKTIILSRTQKVDNEKLLSITSAIRRLNPHASVITTPWERISADTIMAAAEEDAALSLEAQLKKEKKVRIQRHSHGAGCKCGCNHEHNHSHSADEVFDTWGIETPKCFSEGQIREILGAFSNNGLYGSILRGKGILQVENGRWIQFDYVPGEYEFRDTAPDYTGRICVIGSGLNKVQLKNLFHLE